MQILSNYCLKKVDYEFLMFFDKFISKYPFKSYYLMEVLLNKNIVYIKDTTMIIELLKIDKDDILNIFSLFKEMLRNNLINRIIFKKEVLLIYFQDEFIVSFFEEKNKWLVIPLVNLLMEFGLKAYFDVFVENKDVLKLMLLVKINSYDVSIDTKNINNINDNHKHFVLSFYNNNDNNLMFSFDKNIFWNNLCEKLDVK